MIIMVFYLVICLLNGIL